MKTSVETVSGIVCSSMAFEGHIITDEKHERLTRQLEVEVASGKHLRHLAEAIMFLEALQKETT